MVFEKVGLVREKTFGGDIKVQRPTDDGGRAGGGGL